MSLQRCSHDGSDNATRVGHAVPLGRLSIDQQPHATSDPNDALSEFCEVDALPCAQVEFLCSAHRWSAKMEVRRRKGWNRTNAIGDGDRNGGADQAGFGLPIIAPRSACVNVVRRRLRLASTRARDITASRVYCQTPSERSDLHETQSHLDLHQCGSCDS